MWPQLREVAEIHTGYPFRGKVIPEEGGDVAVIQMRDIDPAVGLRPASCLRLRGQDGRFDKYLVRPGDLLMQSRGSRNTSILVDQAVRGIAALGLYVIRPKSDAIRAEYLAWYLGHPRVLPQLRDKARGTYIPFVPKAGLAEITIPVPTLDVQEKIIAVHRLHAEQARLTANLEQKLRELADAATWQFAASIQRKGT
jgi:Type I restriction modification DNA specificity domain